MFRRTFMLSLAFALAALAVCAAPSGPLPAAPRGFVQEFDDLAAFLDRDDLSGLEMAQAAMIASRVFDAGTQAMPYVQARFVRAVTQGQAALAGVYLVGIGSTAERALIRRQVESNTTKRKWIWANVSTEERFFSALQEGTQWRAAIPLLPSTAKCRALAELCLDSRDLLTRRAGLFWGWWVADASYWKKVQTASQTDADAVTKKIALRLLSGHAKQK